MTRQILFVAPQVPWPLDVGSKIRVYNLLRSYAEMGPVTLVCLAENEAEAQAACHLDPYCERIDCLPLLPARPAPGKSSGWFGILRGLIRFRPRLAQFFYCPQLAKRVEELVTAEHFDIVHVERLFMTINADAVLRCRSGPGHPLVVLDVDDLESDKARRSAALCNWHSPRKYFDILEFLKLRIFELRILPRFDCVLVCSERDRSGLRRNHALSWIEVFSNGADLDDTVLPMGVRDDGRTLVFLGAMNYQPNEDAAIFFIEAIFPLIKQRLPDARFVVAGKSPSPRLLALHNGRDLFVTGYVEDKQQLFASCTVFVVPLRIGGGTRLKILEAMAYGRPVVSTTIGCEGIEVAPNENILVADSSEDFALACFDLLSDEERRHLVGCAGRELVQHAYHWEAIRSGFVRMLEGFFHQSSPSETRERA